MMDSENVQSIKTKILDHLSKSHNEDVVDFATEITLNELSVWATTTRLTGGDAEMFRLLKQDKHYYHAIRHRNQTIKSRQSPVFG